MVDEDEEDSPSGRVREAWDALGKRDAVLTMVFGVLAAAGSAVYQLEKSPLYNPASWSVPPGEPRFDVWALVFPTIFAAGIYLFGAFMWHLWKVPEHRLASEQAAHQNTRQALADLQNETGPPRVALDLTGYVRSEEVERMLADQKARADEALAAAKQEAEDARNHHQGTWHADLLGRTATQAVLRRKAAFYHQVITRWEDCAAPHPNRPDEAWQRAKAESILRNNRGLAALGLPDIPGEGAPVVDYLAWVGEVRPIVERAAAEMRSQADALIEPGEQDMLDLAEQIEAINSQRMRTRWAGSMYSLDQLVQEGKKLVAEIEDESNYEPNGPLTHKTTQKVAIEWWQKLRGAALPLFPDAPEWCFSFAWGSPMGHQDGSPNTEWELASGIVWTTRHLVETWEYMMDVHWLSVGEKPKRLRP